MKRSAVLLVACGAIIALAFVLLALRRDRPHDTPAPPALGDGAAGQRKLDVRAGARDSGSRQGAAGGRSADASGGGRRGGAEKQMPPPRLSGAGTAARHGVTEGEAAAPLAPRAGSQESLEPRLTHDDLPPAGSAPGAAQEPASDDAADEASDVVYDAGDDRIFDTGSRVEVAEAGPINAEAGTVSFWIEPQWAQDSADNASFVQLGDSGLQIVKDGTFLRFEHGGNLGAEFGGGVDIADWQSGDWRNVVAIWNGRMMALYVDGVQMFVNTPPGAPGFQGESKLYVGSPPASGGAVAPGRLSYLTVLNREASMDEVRQFFESGGRSHGAP